MRVARAPSALALIAAVGACHQTPPAAPPAGQVVLHVDTDAPIAPQAPGPPSSATPLPLFDRVRFDVYGPGASSACDGCTNEFTVTSDAFAQGAVSVGIAIPVGADGWTARVRMFPLALALPDGEPNPDTTVDVTVALPVLAADGVVDLTVVLETANAGQAPGKNPAVQPVPGLPGPSAVGTWSGAQRVGCTGSAPAGMVCVPGGAFWMGSSGDDFSQNNIPGWHRLVVLSPFFLDETELTVQGARPAIQASAGADEPITWTGSSAGTQAPDWCTYTDMPGPRDALPINCIDPIRAHEICAALVPKGDLPTEAQLEYVMGGLSMQPFAWGPEQPLCPDAVWGRNGFGFLAMAEPDTCLSYSKALGTLGGPEVPGTGRLDVLALPGGNIVDLTGNVSEWARDWFQFQSDECWSPPGVRKDPFCGTPSKALGKQEVNRGGGWGTGGTGLEATERQYTYFGGVSPYNGFRCMAPGG